MSYNHYNEKRSIPTFFKIYYGKYLAILQER